MANTEFFQVLFKNEKKLIMKRILFMTLFDVETSGARMYYHLIGEWSERLGNE
jgi:hypothetical protein